MSKRKSSGNFLSKNVGRFVEKAGRFSLDSAIDAASGGGGKKKPAAGSASHRATDWSSRPAAPVPTTRRRSR